MEHLFHLQKSGALRYVILLVEGKMFFSQSNSLISDVNYSTYKVQTVLYSNQ